MYELYKSYRLNKISFRFSNMVEKNFGYMDRFREIDREMKEVGQTGRWRRDETGSQRKKWR